MCFRYSAVLLFVAVVILCSAAFLWYRNSQARSFSSTMREVAQGTRAVAARVVTATATAASSGPRYERAPTSDAEGEWEQMDDAHSTHPVNGYEPYSDARPNGTWGPTSKEGERVSYGDGVQLATFRSNGANPAAGGNGHPQHENGTTSTTSTSRDL